MTAAPSRFTKRPITIEAIQWAGGNGFHLADWCGGRVEKAANPADTKIVIPTLEGDITASHDDWIIKGVQGEFYPCKPDIFEATYVPDEGPTHDVLANGPGSAPAEPECTCPAVDPSLWTTHYGAVDPATMSEWEPTCPAHGSMSIIDALTARAVAAEAAVARVRGLAEEATQRAYHQIALDKVLTFLPLPGGRAMVPPHWRADAEAAATLTVADILRALDGGQS